MPEPLFEYYGMPLKGLVVRNGPEDEDDDDVPADDEPELTYQ